MGAKGVEPIPQIDPRSSWLLLHQSGSLGKVLLEQLPIDAGWRSVGPLLDELLVARSLREFGAVGGQAAVLTDTANHLIAGQLAGHLVSELALQYHLSVANLALGTGTLRLGQTLLGQLEGGLLGFPRFRGLGGLQRLAGLVRLERLR